MKRVATAAALIPIVLVLVFLSARWHWLFNMAVALVAALSGWEYMALTRRCGANPPRIATLVALMALFVVNFEWPDLTPAFFGFLGLCLLVYCTFFKPVAETIADASASIFCLLYTGLTLIALPSLREQANGPSLVLLLLCSVWAGDTAAYYAGRAFGRHKLAPTISPGKTWEGSIASVAGSVVIAAVLFSLATVMQEPSNSAILAWLERTFPSAVLAYPDELWYWLLLAAIINIAGQVGDLAESALKRSAGVKDSGNLLPGHGGMLDRIDALLLAAPVLWYAQLIHQRF
ncbi:MAG TPA: phosphatidate cytidylyltransferase [Terracidiphilus sp.]|nr:phosphatidate cytidylyltransferase [Terracidiphilus sp.]